MMSAIFGVWRVRAQGPIEVAGPDRQYNFPEPDLAIVRDADFIPGERHPRGDELLLVVEVADTTLRGDLTVKRDLYARAGVPEYWVLSLKTRKLMVHRELAGDCYLNIVTLDVHESVTIGDRTIAVAAMLPR
jgi:Uma2 family endonuclease